MYNSESRGEEKRTGREEGRGNERETTEPTDWRQNNRVTNDGIDDVLLNKK